MPLIGQPFLCVSMLNFSDKVHAFMELTFWDVYMEARRDTTQANVEPS